MGNVNLGGSSLGERSKTASEPGRAYPLTPFHAPLTEHCSRSPVLAAAHRIGRISLGSPAMNGIIYLVGLVVIVLAVLSLIGLR